MLSDMPTISQRPGCEVRVKNVAVMAFVILLGEARQTKMEDPGQDHSEGTAHMDLVTSVDTDQG